MAEPAEVARNLEEFIKRVQRRATGGGGQTQVLANPLPPGAPRPKSIYERCVDELTNDERNELDRMIDKMNQAVPDPPGAIQP